ncbi:MAG: hypothetical protein ACRDYW_04515 [Acidimicrobiales bacterium]
MRALRPLIRSSLVALVVAGSLVLPGGPPAGAVASNVTVTSAVNGGADFASLAYGDPWDYSNVEDQPIIAGATTADLNGAEVRDGRLVINARQGGFVAPVVSWDDLGAVPWGRDGSLIPIDANRFTHLSVHMRVENGGSGTVMWFNCGIATGSCQGQKGFSTTPGWRTYDIPLTTGAGGVAWQGQIKGLRFYPANAGGWAEIDWIRLHAPGQTATVSFSDSSSNTTPQVIWDADTNPGNNTTAASGWGRLDVSGSGGSRTFDAAGLPQGTYRVGVVDDGQTTYASGSMTVSAPPAPVVIDPDRTGGLDYATWAGNAWDLNDAGDVYRVGNADWAVANGLLYGRNTGPLTNDPHVVLSQYGAIDGSRFHRLTLRMGHEGGFGLEDAPGAGMNSRIVWTVPSNPSLAQVSDDLVVYPGWHTNTLDLATWPPNAIAEPGTPGQAGWAGQQITSFRIDPNEDPGARQWYIDDVRLAEDDTAYGGTFDIRFRDLDWKPGTTAVLRADSDRAGCDGTTIASGVPVTSGVNTVRWSPRPIPAGTYWVCLTLSHAGQSSSAYATGPLQMTTRPSPDLAGGSPFGSIDHIGRVPGGLSVAGWAIDPDQVEPIDVHVYVGQHGVATRADLSRPDVGNAYPVYGDQHGYAATVPVGEGTYDVCAYAINVGVGSTTLLRCQVVHVSSTPFGRIDGVRQVPGGVSFVGWALDPDTAASIDVHAYAGRSGVATTANLARGDIAAAFGGYGAAHGFSTVAPVAAGGRQDLCAYAINVGPGGLGVLGCVGADLRVDPWGALDLVQRVPGGVRVAGWAIDPSTAASLDVHVYVGGAGTSIRADRTRNDLLGPFPEWGPAHGFDQVLGAPSGPVQVCAYGINQGLGGHVLLGCRTV